MCPNQLAQSKNEEEIIELKPASKKVGDILNKYEKNFWSQEGKDKTDESNQQYWYQIQHYINKLDKHKIFNTKIFLNLVIHFQSLQRKKRILLNIAYWLESLQRFLI